MSKYRSKTHFLLLYPDNDNHAKALNIIKKQYEYAAILHDKDIIDADDINDELCEGEKIIGKLKKPHYHIVIRTTNHTWNSALTKELGIEMRFARKPHSIDSALRYLIHYDNQDKYQYNIDEVFGSLKTRLKENINKEEKSEGEKVVELIEYIEKCDHKLSIKDFASFCASNGYWSEFRRSGAIFIKIIDEHNSKY